MEALIDASVGLALILLILWRIDKSVFQDNKDLRARKSINGSFVRWRWLQHEFWRRVELLTFIVVILTVIMLSIFAPLVVLMWQVIRWLRDGVWTPMKFGLLWLGTDYANLAPHWRGVQEIIDWIGDWPLTVGLFAIGIVAWGAVALFASERQNAPSQPSPEAEQQDHLF